MAFPIRLSPSGPVIGGAGMQLRADENADPLINQPITTVATELTFNSGDGRGSLLNPKVDLNYGAECRFNVHNVDASNAAVLTVVLQLSYDQVTWFPQKTNAYDLEPASSNLVSVQNPFRLGSALTNVMPGGAAQIASRVLLSASANGDLTITLDDIGCYFMTLKELAA